MSKRAPGRYERRERDFYPTEMKAVAPLIPHLRAARVRQFCEPCCGDRRLVRNLKSFGLVCKMASDIAEGQDALAIASFPAPVITNPPYARELMHALIWHFMRAAPFAWVLVEADWIHTKQARPLLPHCSDIVTIGRLRLIDGSPSRGWLNYVWARFDIAHTAGPRQHVEGQPLGRLCECGFGLSFVPKRSDARFYDPTHRQRARRARLAVT